MRFIHIIMCYVLAVVVYDQFGKYENTNWSIYYNSLIDLFIICSLYLSIKREKGRIRILYLGLMLAFFIEWVLLLWCINMPFSEFEEMTGRSYCYDFGLLIIIVYYLFDYGSCSNKNSCKRNR